MNKPQNVQNTQNANTAQSIEAVQLQLKSHTVNLVM